MKFYAGKTAGFVIDVVVSEYGYEDGILKDSGDENMVLAEADLLGGGRVYDFKPCRARQGGEPPSKRLKTGDISYPGIYPGAVCEECNVRAWSLMSGSVIETPGISKVMEGLGEFPQQYYIRHEATILFDLIEKFFEIPEKGVVPGFDSRRQKKLVIAGSPRVGKSVFLLLFAFYLATRRSQHVLLFCKLKDTKFGYACVILSRDGYSTYPVKSIDDMIDVHDQLREEYPNSWYFLDDFTMGDVDTHHGALVPYDLLATSSQKFYLKGDDPAELYVLPAWQSHDLEVYAKERRQPGGAAGAGG